MADTKTVKPASPFAGLRVTEERELPKTQQKRTKAVNPLAEVFQKSLDSGKPLGFDMPNEEDAKTAVSFLRRAAADAGKGVKVRATNENGKWRVRFQAGDKRRYTQA